MTPLISPTDDDERCLRLAMQYEEPLTFFDYLSSTVIALRSHGTPAEVALERFARLAERSQAGSQLVRDALARLQSGDAWNNRIIDAVLPVAAVPFFDTLLRGDLRGASRIINKLRLRGTPLEEIYLTILEPSQQEIGRLWEVGVVNVAQGHAFTSGVLRIMHDIGPSLQPALTSDRVMVAASAEGDQHSIGVAMVADVYRMRNWNVHILGGDVPVADLLDFTEESGADVLAVSITLLKNLGVASRIRAAMDVRKGLAHTRFIVGGRIFNVAPGLWVKTGADSFAPDAKRAFSQAEK